MKPNLAAPWIARLDRVAGSFFSLEKDPVVVGLLGVGDDAVEPLIDVVEHDDRISQVEFDKEHEWEKPTRAPVYRLAYRVLERLIDTGYFASSNAEMRMARGERAQVAAELRAEWAKWRGVTRAERWFRVFADDNASHEHWMDAASKIFTFVPDPHTYDPFDVTTKLPLQGAALRSHAQPSVSELVARRVTQVELRDGCELARLLGRWDPQATRTIAATQMARAIAATKTSHEYGHCVWALAVVRAELGDTAALDEYAAWIAGTQPPSDNWDYLAFQPMWHYAKRPAMQQAADRLFGAGSPWLPLEANYYRAQLLEQPMYGVPAFQRYILGRLADTQVIGSVSTSGDHDWDFKLASGINSSTTEPNANDIPTTPTTLQVRACDFYAYQVGRQYKAPRFALYWDQAHRDRALADIAAWVRAQQP